MCAMSRRVCVRLAFGLLLALSYGVQYGESFTSTPDRIASYQSSLNKRQFYRANHPLTSRSTGYWDGDDIRWKQKWRRRLKRSFVSSLTQTPTRTTLIAINIIMYIYQVVSAVSWFRARYPTFWSSGHGGTIVFDSIFGQARPGPLTLDLMFASRVAKFQPHRYITSGFLHGGIIHLLFNMDSLRNLPSWLETGMGAPLFLSTYLVSIITGNLGHSSWSIEGMESFALGASGGICGLYGLLLVCLQRMGNQSAVAYVSRRMVFILCYGLLGSNISTAAHVGGFLGGVVMAVLFGPTYRTSYSMRRKWSVQADPIASKEYRSFIGYGKVPTAGRLPLAVLYISSVVAFLANPTLRAVPQQVFQSLIRPGSLSGVL